MTDEQKKLTEQMVEDITAEIEAEVKNEAAPEKKANPLVDGILEWGKQVDFDNVKENSVLMIKVNTDDPQYAHGFQMGVVRHLLEPRFEMLKVKKVTVLFLSAKDDISVLTEEDMNKAGWVKKEPSRIIIPK